MQQQISVVTLAIDSLDASRGFYQHGFGWHPVFENAEISFYQMNGLMLGTWLRPAMAEELGRAIAPSSGFALARNVPSREDVQPTIDRLLAAGGTLMRAASAPRMAAFAAMLPIRKDIHGKSPGTPAGRSTPTVASPSASVHPRLHPPR